MGAELIPGSQHEQEMKELPGSFLVGEYVVWGFSPNVCVTGSLRILQPFFQNQIVFVWVLVKD